MSLNAAKWGVLRLANVVMSYGRILKATTEVELRKKFAGSTLGSIWLVLHPLMFLLIYLFLFLVVFRVRFPDMSSLGYAIYVFAGLVPYIAMMEATTSGAVVIRQNMHLVRNVIVPIELVPVRCVLMVMAAELVGLALLVILLVVDGTLSWYVTALPLLLALQIAFMLGIVLTVSALGVLLPDIGYGINLVMIFLMFVAPIGFRMDMVPSGARMFVMLNPVTYMLEAFRSCLIVGYGPNWPAIAIFMSLSVLSLVGGAAFFHRFKSVIVDYE